MLVFKTNISAKSKLLAAFIPWDKEGKEEDKNVTPFPKCPVFSKSENN